MTEDTTATSSSWWTTTHAKVVFGVVALLVVAVAIAVTVSLADRRDGLSDYDGAAGDACTAAIADELGIDDEDADLYLDEVSGDKDTQAISGSVYVPNSDGTDTVQHHYTCTAELDGETWTVKSSTVF